MDKFIAVFGLLVLIGLPYWFSKHRQLIKPRQIFAGLGLQLLLGVLVLGIPALGLQAPLGGLFAAANSAINEIIGYTDEGTRFLFGGLFDMDRNGFVFALKVLPPVIFFSSLMAVLYHLNIMQWVVKAMAWIMQRVLGTSGAESLSMAANVFVGQTEAPLVVRPYIAGMTRSELFTLMVGGMATVSGGALAGYVSLLNSQFPNIAGHLLTASVMSAPAALMMAKLMLPETEQPETMGTIPHMKSGDSYTNVIEAAAKGASDGMALVLNVLAMLLAFVALIALLNGVFDLVGGWVQFQDWGGFFYPVGTPPSEVKLTIELLLGWVFAPVALLMGIPWADALLAGNLLGQKIVLNEFIAYISLADSLDLLSERSVIILSYALCGFANFSSIAIQIGGIGGVAPSRTKELAQFGIRSIIGGSLAAFSTATLAGLLI